MAPRYNYLQPIYLEFTNALTEDITGYTMPFPNLEQFKSRYGEAQEKAPTNSLIDTLRLLLPQIRVINNLTKNGSPNPAAFLANEKIEPKILSLIFRKWVEVWYPESEHESLKSLCSAEQFEWSDATPEALEWWSPAWAIAKQLSEQEYQLGGRDFKLLFAPGRKENTVELVSWPPFSDTYDNKSSLGLVISTQSDLGDRRINIHFKMKRWIVKRGENLDVNLQSKTTHCYVRRLTSWFSDYNLPQPNSFTVLEAKNFRREDESGYERRWKKQKTLDILKKLSVEIPDIETVLANPLNFIETDEIDILIPARSWQNAGWGTGFTYSDERRLLRQIIGFLPNAATLTKPWLKISTIQKTDKTKKIKEDYKKAKDIIKQRFIKNPSIPKPSQSDFPELTPDVQEFLQQRANNITLYVCTLTSEVKDAIEKVASYYFGDSLKLEFLNSPDLANPLEQNRSGRPDIRHIKKFARANKPDSPRPIIVEILDKDHPSYRGNADPKSHIKSELPKYNLIPQCIVSSESIDAETKKVKADEKLQNSLLNRALSAILDAIMPFDNNYPLSTSKDNAAYAGLYIISRNRVTSNQSFNEPVLVVIYQNEIRVLLPAYDLEFRSMPKAICYLSRRQDPDKNRDRVINKMLSQLSINYSQADNIYLYVHAQNARSYWQWLQDKNFDSNNPPTEKITIIRIRDQSSNEVAPGYGLPVEGEDFSEEFNPELASNAKGIFIPPNCNLDNIPFTQTILSVAQKPQTLSSQVKNTSRVEPYTSKGETKNPTTSANWKAPQTRAHNILATPSPLNFILHHAIAHHLRSSHWWSADECQYPLPLSLAKKIKGWCFSESDSDNLASTARSPAS